VRIESVRRLIFWASFFKKTYSLFQTRRKWTCDYNTFPWLFQAWKWPFQNSMTFPGFPWPYEPWKYRRASVQVMMSRPPPREEEQVPEPSNTAFERRYETYVETHPRNNDVRHTCVPLEPHRVKPWRPPPLCWTVRCDHGARRFTSSASLRCRRSSSPLVCILLFLTEAFFVPPRSLFLSICLRNTSPSFHNHHVYISLSLSLSLSLYSTHPVSPLLSLVFS